MSLKQQRKRAEVQVWEASRQAQGQPRERIEGHEDAGSSAHGQTRLREEDSVNTLIEAGGAKGAGLPQPSCEQTDSDIKVRNLDLEFDDSQMAAARQMRLDQSDMFTFKNEGGELEDAALTDV